MGHALFNDLAVSFLSEGGGACPDSRQALQHRHPYEDVRDTALYYPLRRLPGVNVIHEGQYPGLKTLSRQVLGKEIQKGTHCPVCLRLA